MTADEPLAPLHLVLGDEDLLVDRAISAIVDRATAGPDGADATVSRMRAGEVSVPELMELLSPSLFADRRVVIFEAADQAGKEPAETVLGAAGDIPDGVTLVVVHSGGGRTKTMVPALRKLGAAVHECPRITRASERTDFVRAEFRAAGVRPAPAVVEAVIGAVGHDLRELASAVTQLVTDTGGKVDEDAVRRYYAGRAEVSGFAVADRVVAGDLAGAAETLRWALLGGTAHVLIADALADAIHTLARVGGAGRVDPNRAAGELGMPPWKIRNAQRDLRGWTPETIGEAMSVVARLNGDVKGQAADGDWALERAVARLVELRRAAG